MREPAIAPSRRLDGIDAERFGEMVESEMFGLLRGRVQAELRRAQETCAKSDREVEIRRAQGAAAALEMVLGLPDLLLAEMKAKPRYVHPIPRPASNRVP